VFNKELAHISVILPPEEKAKKIKISSARKPIHYVRGS
jgi:hypothetical protein